MLVLEQFVFAVQQQLVGHSHVLDIHVLVEPVAHHARMIPEDVPERRNYYIRTQNRDFAPFPAHLLS